MKLLNRRWRPISIVFLMLSLILPSEPAEAVETLVLNTSNGTYNAWNQIAGDIYLNRITGVAGSTITSIKSGWANNITSQAATNTVYIFSNVGGAPGSVVATFTYSSNDGSRWATYTGSFTVPVGGTFFLGQRASATINNAGGGLANQISNSWSIYYGSRYSGTSLTGPFTSSGVSTSPLWQIYTGTSATTLTAPEMPVVTTSSTSLGVSETSTVANASSYLIKLFASNGTTVIDSKTATNSSILSDTTFTGLNPNTTYKVGVIAIGDGTNYLDSSMSTLKSVTTSIGTTTISTSIVGNPVQLTYRTSYQIRSDVTGSTGYVIFQVNGKNIPQCRKVSPSSSIATCNWKPSLRGNLTVTTRFISTDSNYSSSQATSTVVRVVGRTNNR